MLSIVPYSNTNQLIKLIVALLNVVLIIKGYFNEHYYIGLVVSLPLAFFVFKRLKLKSNSEDEKKLGKHSYLYYRNNLKKTHL